MAWDNGKMQKKTFVIKDSNAEIAGHEK